MIYADDAPALESALHRRFDDRRLNLINAKKEYFSVSLSEIEAAVYDLHADIEFTRLAEAVEYRESQALRRKRQAEHREPASVLIPTMA
jgi:hypothetical protein